MDNSHQHTFTLRISKQFAEIILEAAYKEKQSANFYIANAVAEKLNYKLINKKGNPLQIERDNAAI